MESVALAVCDWNCARKYNMSEETVKLNKAQFDRIDLLLNAQVGALDRLGDRVAPAGQNVSDNVGKWLSAINDSINAGFKLVAEAIANSNPLPPPQPKLIEVKFMFIVKDNAPDANFSVVLGDVTDAEGNAIPDAQLTLAVLSTDEAVVAVTFDPATKAGSVHFGNPGTATVTATVSSGETLLGSGAADFTVTVGDPAAISNVALSFDGLTEA